MQAYKNFYQISVFFSTNVEHEILVLPSFRVVSRHPYIFEMNDEFFLFGGGGGGEEGWRTFPLMGDLTSTIFVWVGCKWRDPCLSSFLT